MKSFIWINGKLTPAAEAKISVFDSAYLHGIGLFETIRARQGRVLFLKEHYQRLLKNVRFLGFKGVHLPVSLVNLQKEIGRLLRKNRLQEATVRLTLSRHQENGKPQMVIWAKPYVPYAAAFYKKGAKLILVRKVSTDARTLAGIKTTSYLTKMIGREEARTQRAVEGVLVNEKGEITEGASSNLFIVKKGKLLTPPLSMGLLPGTRRQLVVTLARRLGIPFAEKKLKPSDLKKADELFITSTLKDILPIVEFDGKKIGRRCPGPVTLALRKEYEAQLRSRMKLVT
jgi:branched-chain amino acid aminotransferase